MLIAEWVCGTALASGICISHLSGQYLPSAGEAHTEVAPLGAENHDLLRCPLTSHVSLQRHMILACALHGWTRDARRTLQRFATRILDVSYPRYRGVSTLYPP